MVVIKYCFMLLSLSATEVHLQNVPDAFRMANISPGVIKTPPNKLLDVVYDKDIVVCLGNQLTLLQVVNAPIVSFNGDPHSYYTLIMIDPDALYPELINLPGEFLHWLVGNIKGCDVSSGQTVAAYLSPTPPPLSRPHRYIFLLYQHDHEIDYSLDYVTTLNRPIFYINEFVKKHHLYNLEFGNYFNGVII